MDDNTDQRFGPMTKKELLCTTSLMDITHDELAVAGSSGRVPPNTPAIPTEHLEPDMDQLKKLLVKHQDCYSLGQALSLSTYTSNKSIDAARVDDASGRDSALLGEIPDPSVPGTDQVPACWRYSEVKGILERKDIHGIACLLRFRPFNDKFEFGSCIPRPPKMSKTPYSPWKWKEHNSQKLDATEIAVVAAGESMSKFSKISFEEWVRHALGLAPNSIKNLEQQYSDLSCQLYYYLQRHIDEVSKYCEVAEVSSMLPTFEVSAC